MTVGMAYLIFVLRAMDIDKTFARIRVVLFQSIEPKNA